MKRSAHAEEVTDAASPFSCVPTGLDEALNLDPLPRSVLAAGVHEEFEPDGLRPGVEDLRLRGSLAGSTLAPTDLCAVVPSLRTGGPTLAMRRP